MNNSKKNAQELENKESIDYKVNVQMIAFIAVVMVTILSLMYFIKIYSTKKNEMLHQMDTESVLLEAIISDNLNYAKYFIRSIDKTIRQNPKNLNYIKNILQNNFDFQDCNSLFGWRKYSWIDSNFKEVVTSIPGLKLKSEPIDFVKKVVDDQHADHTKKENIIFRINKYVEKGDSLKLIDSIFDDKTHQFIGALVLSYDIETMVKSLNTHKKNSLNYVIIDHDLNVVAKSKSMIDKIVNTNDELSNHLTQRLNQINFKNINNQDNVSYLDMVNGVNYFIKPLKNLPFAVIVNIDNNVIKNNIVEIITIKILEVGFFIAVSVLIIISIYKRETSLRAKSEKATIQANDAAQAKTDFLAFTAHEIRSPLSFILTSSEMISKQPFGPLSKQYIDYIKGIHYNAQTILDFITDILDENQIIEGHFKIVNSLVAVDSIIKQVVEPYLQNKEIKIVTKIAKNLPMLICDKRRILQVIDNLVSNSVKYSPKNPKIKIEAFLENSSLVVVVSDKGIGMNQEDISVAISKYGTIHRQDYQKGGSYGLGLLIVKMLLDAHDATLKIISATGKGTEVKITFAKYKLVYGAEKDKSNMRGN